VSTNNSRRNVLLRLAALAGVALLALTLAALRPPRSTASSSLGQLHSQLGAQQARAHSLSASIASLDRTIASLDSQVTLVRSREATVDAALATDRAQLKRVGGRLRSERAHLALLRRVLARAQSILRRQLVSAYESGRPDLVTVVLESQGFTDLLDRLNYLQMAEHRQQSIIAITQTARARADAAADQLLSLQRTYDQVTRQTQVRADALAGMNQLLSSREAALQSARSAQQSALAASQSSAARIQHQISRVEAAQAAAAARAAQQAASAGALGATGGGSGWAIPYAIVLCESGGQNLPPNSAGASGYYQIIPSTWTLFGGTGPAAYLASKAEQDAVAARIWRGGAGASNWVCAGIVGIH
jgi:septal ring factor EnvC (AmiA/AmiB activator)